MKARKFGQCLDCDAVDAKRSVYDMQFLTGKASNLNLILHAIFPLWKSNRPTMCLHEFCIKDLLYPCLEILF